MTIVGENKKRDGQTEKRMQISHQAEMNNVAQVIAVAGADPGPKSCRPEEKQVARHLVSEVSGAASRGTSTLR